jgi:hypothetical protein
MGRVSQQFVLFVIGAGCVGLLMALIVNGLWALVR